MTWLRRKNISGYRYWEVSFELATILLIYQLPSFAKKMSRHRVHGCNYFADHQLYESESVRQIKINHIHYYWNQDSNNQSNWLLCWPGGGLCIFPCGDVLLIRVSFSGFQLQDRVLFCYSLLLDRVDTFHDWVANVLGGHPIILMATFPHFVIEMYQIPGQRTILFEETRSQGTLGARALIRNETIWK